MNRRAEKKRSRARVLDERVGHLCQAVDLVELIRADPDIRLQVREGTCVGFCPFHQGSDSHSLTIQIREQKFHCQACGFGGTCIGWMMYRHGLGFREAVRHLAAQVQRPDLFPEEPQALEAERQKMRTVREHIALQWHRALLDNPRALGYLMDERHLNAASIEHFEIGWCAKTRLPKGRFGRELWQAGVMVRLASEQYLSRFSDRIIFPIRSLSGSVVGFGARTLGTTHRIKYLNSAASRVFHKQDHLYGLFEALEDEPAPERLILVEGYTDVISLRQYGITGAIATLGTAITEFQMAEICRHTDHLLLCLDSDVAGQAATFKALCHALRVMDDEQRVEILELPPGSDPDAFVRQHGRLGFDRIVQRARPIELWIHNHIAQALLRGEPWRGGDVQASKGGIIRLPENQIGLLARYSIEARNILACARSGSVEARLKAQFECIVGIAL